MIRGLAEQPTVIYIAGFARSGSTLLGNLLGQVHGFSHVGEVGRLWLELTRTDRKSQCGCRRQLSDCSLWSDIVTEIEHSADFPEFEDMLRWYEATTAGPGYPDWRSIDRVAYIDALRRLYLLLWRATGGDVIVDSSKQPAYGTVLSEVPGLQVRVVHLVRDPRGVMGSRLRKSRDATAAVTTRILVLDPIRWRKVNRVSRRLSRETGGLTIRYEDLTAAPAQELGRVIRLIEGAPDLQFIDQAGGIWLEPTHTVWGNKSRFDTGRVEISQDLRWRDELSTFEKTAVKLSTGAPMRRYGYG